MRMESRAFLAATAALIVSGGAAAQSQCDCTTIVGSCEATATVQDGFISVTSDSEQCSRVGYVVNGIPLVALIVDGNEQRDTLGRNDSPSVAVESCQICMDATAATSQSFGGPGLYTEDAVSTLIEVTPAYPAEALAAGVEGFVELRFEVDTNGIAGAPEIVASEPAGVFDAAATDAIRQWRFTRPTSGPQSVTERMEFTISDGVLSLRPDRSLSADSSSRVNPIRNNCIQERTRYDFGTTVDISLINTCKEPLLLYSCTSGTGSLSDRWICRDSERTGNVIGALQTAANDNDPLSPVSQFDITRAANSEYWLLACAVDDTACRSDGREWVRSLNRQAATIDPQARTRARLARSY